MKSYNVMMGHSPVLALGKTVEAMTRPPITAMAFESPVTR